MIPGLGGVHRRLLGRRLRSVQRLLEEAQFLHGVDVALLVAPRDERVSVSLALGFEAVLLVAEVEPLAASFTAVRPWVPIVVVAPGSRRLAFGRVRSAN